MLHQGEVLLMLRALLIAVVVLLATWALLVVAAKRLPPGLLKDLAGFLPACLTTVRRLRTDPRVPRRAKLAILVAGLWLLSPIDLLPEFLPVIGPLDDVLVVALALRYAARSVPRQVLLDAWPADPQLLERLIGHPPVSPRPGPGSRSGPCSRCWCPPPGRVPPQRRSLMAVAGSGDTVLGVADRGIVSGKSLAR